MKPSIFHIYIANKLRYYCEDLNNIITRKEVRDILIRSHIPCKIHKEFLKELQQINFIKPKDKRNIIILKEIEDID